MTRLLIVGAGGMTGREISRRGGDAGFECVAHDRASLDISDSSAVGHAVAEAAPDVIVNAAGYTAVDRAESEIDIVRRANVDGAANLARSAEKRGAAIVHISTDYVFAGSASEPYLPDHPRNPLGVYGQSKSDGEDAVRAISDRHAIVRTSWVFSHAGRNFVRTMVERGQRQGELRVVNDQTGRPTSAADLADALLVVAGAMARDSSRSGTWHFANAGPTTWYDFALAIFSLRGRPGPAVRPSATSDYPTAAPRPAYSVLDTTSFTDTFGVTPRPWLEPLRETLERIP